MSRCSGRYQTFEIYHEVKGFGASTTSRSFCCISFLRGRFNESHPPGGTQHQSHYTHDLCGMHSLIQILLTRDGVRSAEALYLTLTSCVHTLRVGGYNRQRSGVSLPRMTQGHGYVPLERHWSDRNNYIAHKYRYSRSPTAPRHRGVVCISLLIHLANVVC